MTQQLIDALRPRAGHHASSSWASRPGQNPRDSGEDGDVEEDDLEPRIPQRRGPKRRGWLENQLSVSFSFLYSC